MEAPDSAGEVGPTPPPAATLTVAAVARRLGVAPPTLRTWDRRYGLGPSAHTAGAHRRYSSADVARLMVMRRLTLEGVSPADAAKIALASSVSEDGRQVDTPADGFHISAAGFETVHPGFDPAPPARDHSGPGDPAAAQPRTGGYPGDTAAEPPEAGTGVLTFDWQAAGATTADSPGPPPDWSGVLRSVPSERSIPGGGRVVAMPDGTPQTRGLARAAMSIDTHAAYRIMVDTIRREGVITTWNTIIVPVLRALGERVRVTGDGIDVVHAFSEVILAAMRSITFSYEQPHRQPVVLLACADADYHSLPLHALGAALAERDVPTRMLGSGLPPHALSASVRRTGPSVIVLFARMPGADARDTEALWRHRPAPTVVLAGPGWQPESIPASVRTAGSLGEAVDAVLTAVPG